MIRRWRRCWFTLYLTGETRHGRLAWTDLSAPRAFLMTASAAGAQLTFADPAGFFLTAPRLGTWHSALVDRLAVVVMLTA